MAMHFKQNLISSILANSFKNIKHTVTKNGKSLSNTNLQATQRGIYSGTKENNNKGIILHKNNSTIVFENTKSYLNHNRIVKQQLCIRHETVDRNSKYTKLHNLNSTGVKKGRIEKLKVPPNKILFSNKKCNTDTCPKLFAERCRKIQMPNCVSARKGGCKKKYPIPTTKPKPKAPQSCFLECVRDSFHLLKDSRKECNYMNPDIRPHKNPLQRIYKLHISKPLFIESSECTITRKRPLHRISKSEIATSPFCDNSKKEMSLYRLVTVVASKLQSGMKKEHIVRELEHSFKQHNNITGNKAPCRSPNNPGKLKLPNCFSIERKPVPHKPSKRIKPPIPNYIEMQKSLKNYVKNESQKLKLNKKYSMASFR